MNPRFHPRPLTVLWRAHRPLVSPDSGCRVGYHFSLCSMSLRVPAKLQPTIKAAHRPRPGALRWALQIQY